MMDEGYIKFEVEWEQAKPLPIEQLEELDYWRQEMYRLGLIGAYEDGIGFGNISCRWGETGQFMISGSATGNFERLTAAHYSFVKEVIVDENRLVCEGPIIASSESMSHAVIYQSLPEVKGVIHVHHLELWERLLHRVPTTDAGATYGTPEMAYSIMELIERTDLKSQGVFVMEGHREGIFAFGKTLRAAAGRLTHYGRQFALF